MKPITSISTRASHLFTAEDHHLARDTMLAAMKATKTARSRNQEGKIIYVQEPDWSIRLPAAVKIAEFIGGKPVATSITADLTPNSDSNGSDFMASVMADPASLDALMDTLQKQRAAIQAIGERSQAIEVTTTPAKANPVPS